MIPCPLCLIYQQFNFVLVFSVLCGKYLWTMLVKTVLQLIWSYFYLIAIYQAHQQVRQAATNLHRLWPLGTLLTTALEPTYPLVATTPSMWPALASKWVPLNLRRIFPAPHTKRACSRKATKMGVISMYHLIISSFFDCFGVFSLLRVACKTLICLCCL